MQSLGASSRGWTDTPAGRRISILLVMIGTLALSWSVRRAMAPSPAAAASANRTFICSETGQAFQYQLRIGDSIPVRSPYSNKNTGHPAELCNWTREGGIATAPTPVLLQQYRGIAEPTFCPACDRLVVPLNPLAERHSLERGLRPPPTRSQYRNMNPLNRSSAR